MRNLQLLFTLLFIFTVGLSACTKPQVVNLRGNLPNETQLSKLIVGLQNKNDVIELLGSPSSTSMFNTDKESWYYISSKRERFAFFAPEETERSVIAITFDKEGVISAIEKLGLENGNDVAISEDETPTSGHDPSVVRQLLGNIGRFGGGKNRNPIDTEL